MKYIFVKEQMLKLYIFKKLHGCVLLQYLHQQYGNARNDPIISRYVPKNEDGFLQFY